MSLATDSDRQTLSASRRDPSVEGSSSWSRWVVPAFAVLLAGMALYLLTTILSGLDRLQAALAHFPAASHVPVVLGLVIVGWLLRAVRWHYYARTLGWPVPFGPNVLAFCASFAFTATPGKAGEVVKAALLRTRYGVSLADTAGVLLVERMGDVMAMLLLGLGGLALLPNGWAIFIVAVLGMGAMTVFLTNEGLYRPLLRRASTLPRAERLAHKVLQLVATGRVLLRPQPLLVGLAIAILAWSCEALAFWLILSGLGVGMAAFVAFSVYALATVIGAVSMLPGGIGGVEAAMLLFLAVLGVDAGSAVAAVLLIRLSTLYFVSILGIACMGVWWLNARRTPSLNNARAH